jgi:hypothetical protein
MLLAHAQRDKERDATTGARAKLALLEFPHVSQVSNPKVFDYLFCPSRTGVTEENHRLVVYRPRCRLSVRKTVKPVPTAELYVGNLPRNTLEGVRSHYVLKVKLSL